MTTPTPTEGPVAVYAKGIVSFLGIVGVLLLGLVGVPGIPEAVNGWLSVAAGVVTVAGVVITRNAPTVDALFDAARKLGFSVKKS